jgi:hypothetical protein
MYSGITIIPGSQKLMKRRLIQKIPKNEREIQIKEIKSNLGREYDRINVLPDVFKQCKFEEEKEMKNWNNFLSVLKISCEYNSKYKSCFEQLDEMGCINLAK